GRLLAVARGRGGFGRRLRLFLFAAPFFSDVFAARFVYRLGLLGTDTVDIQNSLQIGFGNLFGGFEARLIHQLRRHVVDAGNRAERNARAPRLFFHLRFAAHVELPSGQARGQAHVLSALADRQRELIVGDDDFHAVLVVVDDDFRYFRGGEGAADV